MKLYEIEEAIRNFEFEVDPETGEVLNAEALDELQVAKEAKIEGIACLIKERRAEAKAILEEYKNLKTRADRLENSADSLENWLAEILAGDKFSTSKVNITWRKSERVDIISEAMLPDKFCVYKTTRTPDKTAIKKAIKEGAEVEGAVLTQHNNIKVG